MESDKFYSECWNKAKKDTAECVIKLCTDDTSEGKFKCSIAEGLLEYFKDIEVKVKEGK